MPAIVRHVTFDTLDPYPLARFWSAVTGHPLDDEDVPGADECAVVPPDGTGPLLLFVRVADAKVGKNRVHLDVAPDDRTRDQEVDRLTALGARVVADHRRPNGRGWVVLADPEGNEFCVECSDAERAALSAPTD